MTNQDLIRKAVVTHFACDRKTLSCDTKLEDSAGIAKDFMDFYLYGTRSDGFNKAMRTIRGKIKVELIERYINNNSDGFGQ